MANRGIIDEREMDGIIELGANDTYFQDQPNLTSEVLTQAASSGPAAENYQMGMAAFYAAQGDSGSSYYDSYASSEVAETPQNDPASDTSDQVAQNQAQSAPSGFGTNEYYTAQGDSGSANNQTSWSLESAMGWGELNAQTVESIDWDAVNASLQEWEASGYSGVMESISIETNLSQADQQVYQELAEAQIEAQKAPQIDSQSAQATVPEAIQAEINQTGGLNLEGPAFYGVGDHGHNGQTRVYDWLPEHVKNLAQTSTHGHALLTTSDQINTVGQFLESRELGYALVVEKEVDVTYYHGDSGSPYTSKEMRPTTVYMSKEEYVSATGQEPKPEDLKYRITNSFNESVGGGDNGPTEYNYTDKIGSSAELLSAVGLNPSVSADLNIAFNTSGSGSGDVWLGTSQKDPNQIHFGQLDGAYQAVANDVLASNFVQIGDLGPLNDDIGKMLNDVYKQYGVENDPQGQEVIKSQLFVYDDRFGVLANKDFVDAATEMNNNRKQGFFEKSVGRALLMVAVSFIPGANVAVGTMLGATVTAGGVMSAALGAAFTAADGGSFGDILKGAAGGLVGSAVGNLAGVQAVGSLGVEGLAADVIGGAVSRSVTSAVEQVIRTGDLDLEAVLVAGAAGGVGAGIASSVGSSEFGKEIAKNLGVSSQAVGQAAAGAAVSLATGDPLVGLINSLGSLGSAMVNGLPAEAIVSHNEDGSMSIKLPDGTHITKSLDQMYTLKPDGTSRLDQLINGEIWRSDFDKDGSLMESAYVIDRPIERVQQAVDGNAESIYLSQNDFQGEGDNSYQDAMALDNDANFRAPSSGALGSQFNSDSDRELRHSEDMVEYDRQTQELVRFMNMLDKGSVEEYNEFGAKRVTINNKDEGISFSLTTDSSQNTAKISLTLPGGSNASWEMLPDGSMYVTQNGEGRQLSEAEANEILRKAQERTGDPVAHIPSHVFGDPIVINILMELVPGLDERGEAIQARARNESQFDLSDSDLFVPYNLQGADNSNEEFGQYQPAVEPTDNDSQYQAPVGGVSFGPDADRVLNENNLVSATYTKDELGLETWRNPETGQVVFQRTPEGVTLAVTNGRSVLSDTDGRVVSIKGGSFGEAFAQARASGAQTFEWTNQSGRAGFYNTELRKDLPPVVLSASYDVNELGDSLVSPDLLVASGSDVAKFYEAKDSIDREIRSLLNRQPSPLSGPLPSTAVASSTPSPFGAEMMIGMEPAVGAPDVSKEQWALLEGMASLVPGIGHAISAGNLANGSSSLATNEPASTLDNMANMAGLVFGGVGSMGVKGAVRGAHLLQDLVTPVKEFMKDVLFLGERYGQRAQAAVHSVETGKISSGAIVDISHIIDGEQFTTKGVFRGYDKNGAMVLERHLDNGAEVIKFDGTDAIKQVEVKFPVVSSKNADFSIDQLIVGAPINVLTFGSHADDLKKVRGTFSGRDGNNLLIDLGESAPQRYIGVPLTSIREVSSGGTVGSILKEAPASPIPSAEVKFQARG